MLTSIEKKINNQTNITQQYLSKISKNNKWYQEKKNHCILFYL